MTKNMGVEIIGIGASTVDILMPVDEFSEGEGTEKVSEIQMAGGGPVATACVVASKMGVRTGMVDRVGTDWRGEFIGRDFKAFNVCTDELVYSQGKQSPLSVIQVRRCDGARRIFWQPGTVGELVVDELPVMSLRDCRYLHINGRHQDAALEAAAIVRRHGGVVSFDGGCGRYTEGVREYVGLVDWWIVARTFATAWVGEMEPLEQVRRLLVEGGGSFAGITDGVEGAWFANADGVVWHQPAYLAERVVDTTGCGDVFHGAFLAAHAHGLDFREAGYIAARAAARKVGGYGGRACLPGWEEALSWLSGLEG